MVLDRAAGPRPVRRNDKRGSAESRTPGDPQRLKAVRQPGGAERGTFRAHRHPVDGPVRLAPDASTATASPGGRCADACGGKTEGVCPPRTRVRQLATGRAPGCRAAGRRPGRRCDRAVTWPARPIKAAGCHMARQPGSEGLKAGAVPAAIYDAARQDDAGLSYNQC